MISRGSLSWAYTAFGKHLFTRFDDGRSLHTHFRMDGAWHLYRPGQRWRRSGHQARAVLNTQERVAVGFLLYPRHAEALEAAAKATDDKRRPLVAELSVCEHLADELSGRLGRREITLQRYDVAMVPLDKRIAELRAELAELDSVPAAVADPAVVAASREEWIARWDAATVAERRSFIRQALANRRIVIAPADPSRPRKFDPRRIVIEEVTPYPR